MKLAVNPPRPWQNWQAPVSRQHQKIGRPSWSARWRVRPACESLVVVWLVVMYGTAAATEVVYYASKSLTQVRCCTASNRQQAPGGCGAIQHTPASRKFSLASRGDWLWHFQGRPGLVDSSWISSSSGTFFRGVHPDSEMASQNDHQKKAK